LSKQPNLDQLHQFNPTPKNAAGDDGCLSPILVDVFRSPAEPSVQQRLALSSQACNYEFGRRPSFGNNGAPRNWIRASNGLPAPGPASNKGTTKTLQSRCKVIGK
jgi:hypothetical protein